MNFAAEPGVMFDVIVYNVLYFNQAAKKWWNRNSDFGVDPLSYFNSFRTGRRRVDPADFLYPFFYFNQRLYPKDVPLTQYFWDKYVYLGWDAERFMESLRGEEYRRLCYKYHLDGVSPAVDLDKVLKGDPESVMAAIASLSSHGDNLVYFIDFFIRFDEMAEELISCLRGCRKKMAVFHEKCAAPLLPALYDDCVAYEDTVKRMHGILPDVSLARERITVHLMDHLALFCGAVSSGSYIFFLGANCKKLILRWSEYGKVTLRTFGQAIGNEVNLDIIEELRRGERTVSQLAKKLFISRSTVDRCLHALHEELVVTVVRKIGAEIYYALNPHYILMAKAEMLVFLDGLWRDLQTDH
ncbi:MAG: helix-turn-helix domain-containing protein [Oscillospiraceae bacterium]|jgi:DNA-binding transcriptional ArsR family regulator|nr:helix-turn-helix domain-containing protein [Oscillospiraceae bacterium]